MPDRLLVITGGCGRIGTAIRPFLREQYRLRVLDVHQAPAGWDGDEYVAVDVTDVAGLEPALAGADAVLHLAGNPSPAATWADVRQSNVEGTNSVFEAARRQGVSKVVFASSNHVMGFYNLEGEWPIDTYRAIRPDSLYGVSKAFGEALGRYYSDAFGISVICLRIGWFTAGQPDNSHLNPLWISARDLAQVILRSLDTPRRFGIYNATSNNAHMHWDLRTARDELGYQPVDNVVAVATDTQAAPYVDPRAGVTGGQLP